MSRLGRAASSWIAMSMIRFSAAVTPLIVPPAAMSMTG
jgi:hypothetical protein